MPTANRGGWKTCSRGHRYRKLSFCPVCMPGRARRTPEQEKNGRRKGKGRR